MSLNALRYLAQLACRHLLRFAGLIAGLAVAGAAAGAPPARGIAVLYPDIGEPYRSVFAKIVEGVEDQVRAPVPAIAVGANANAPDVMAELRRQETRVVIALGRNGLKIAANLERDIAVVGGGVLSVPEADARNMQVLSLAPDPVLLFSRLHSFMPAAKRIFTVYDPRQNAWLMKLARDAAAARGMELIAYEAQDLKTALRIYQEIFAAADPRRDALWLPQDATTVDETSVLPLVLQETWTRNLALFSSNVSHVRRGALFALYPNNVEIGRFLATAALGYLSGNAGGRGLMPLRAVMLAVNVRTASHLGLGTGSRGADLVFPEE